MRKTIAICLFVSTVLVLAACESTPKKRKGDGDEFYDGREKTLYQTGKEAKTTEEAFQRGQNALAGGDTDRALYEFVQAYVLDNENADALHQIGVIHAGRNNNLKAIVAFGKVLKIKQDTLKEEEKSKGKDEASKNRQLNKDVLDAQEWLGLLHMRQRSYAGATGFLEAVVKEDEKRWRAYNALAVIADLQKNYDSAHAYYLKALAANPGSPVLLNNLGYSQYLAGDWNRAIVTISMALRAAPDYKKAWHNLALIYVRQKRYDEALRALGQIMDRPHAYAAIGDLSLLERDYARAEDYLLKAIKASPAYFKEAFDSLERVREYKSKTDQGVMPLGAEPGWVGPESPLGETGLPGGPGADPGLFPGQVGSPGPPAQVFPTVPQDTVTGTPIEPENKPAPVGANVSMPAGTVADPSVKVAPPMVPPEADAIKGATAGSPLEDSTPPPFAPAEEPGPAAVPVQPAESVKPEPRVTSPTEAKEALSTGPAKRPVPDGTPTLPTDAEVQEAQTKAALRENEDADRVPPEGPQTPEIPAGPGGESNKTKATDTMEQPLEKIMAPSGTTPIPQMTPAEEQMTNDVKPGQSAPATTDTANSSPEPALGTEPDTAKDDPDVSPTSDVKELEQPGSAAPDTN